MSYDVAFDLTPSVSAWNDANRRDSWWWRRERATCVQFWRMLL